MKKVENVTEMREFLIVVALCIASILVGVVINAFMPKEKPKENKKEIFVKKNKRNVWLFYLINYRNVETDGIWSGWNPKNASDIPFFQKSTVRKPKFSFYSSNDETLIAKHMKIIADSGVDSLIINWTSFTNPINETKRYKNKTVSTKRDVIYNTFNNYTEVNIDLTTYPVQDPLNCIIKEAKEKKITVALVIPFKENRTMEMIEQDIIQFFRVADANGNAMRYNGRKVVFIEGLNSLEFDERRKISLNDYFFFSIGETKDEATEAFCSSFNGFASMSKNSSAFAAFDDREMFILPVISPGRERVTINKENDTYTISRRNGLEYIESWKSALRYGSDTVVIDSFNNWVDGTEIEPAFEDDSLKYMKITKQMITKLNKAA